MSRCCGCGVELQDTYEEKDGYVESLDYQLCRRCFMINNYGKNVETQKDNADYMKILDMITDDDLVVYVSSLLTLNLDYINKFKNVVLVLTKRDIMPKSIKDEKIINYVKERYDNLLDVIVVSAYKKMNLDQLYNRINQYGRGKNVYFVGTTNSGKSTLINEMIKSYNGVEGNITMSNYPSTTLGVIDVILRDLKVKDTPGIVIPNSIINYMDSKGIKKINSKKEIKPITFQIKGHGAVLVDGVLRVEYETDESSMTFYVSNNLLVKKISLGNPRLADGDEVNFMLNDGQDIVIEDVGFIKFTNKVNVKIQHNDSVCISVRDNLI